MVDVLELLQEPVAGAGDNPLSRSAKSDTAEQTPMKTKDEKGTLGHPLTRAWCRDAGRAA